MVESNVHIGMGKVDSVTHSNRLSVTDKSFSTTRQLITCANELGRIIMQDSSLTMTTRQKLADIKRTLLNIPREE